ncbi:Serine/threonine-protein phosphatase 4 catalytic subunit [Aduncisulcus paluster]|uniref:Serine/threonine-protein phosphatase n=1 Tax=Aduncisulcus paluster TaxID=2918883 RepID=A0ABQ5JXT2_9EUKA|nr:Serine/threonine-protein phosphatase 4 catalytic subunit [Aduncisulcus paluster]GKT15516.1 Serine/threonine-protein phosphatase 4 catalytic subunit [Aduncisulcus paluster]
MGTGDLDKYIAKLERCELIDDGEVKNLCIKAREILSKEANIVMVDGAVTVCGDIHGQFFDLKELFRVGGHCPHTNYVFLGDYVDRGSYSVETFLWLLALKVRYPSRMTLIRGNHESRQTTQVYGFYDESVRKYGTVKVWRYCTQVFDYLTLSALVSNSVFCVHGGLSPSISALDEIREINRVIDAPHDGAMSDLLWSDPDDVDGYAASTRGAGYLFGERIVKKFCDTNDLSLIARAHQLVMEGYKFMFDKKLVTVWSCGNYCYRCGNSAAIMELFCTGSGSVLNKYFKVFQAAPASDRNPPSRKVTPDYYLV